MRKATKPLVLFLIGTAFGIMTKDCLAQHPFPIDLKGYDDQGNIVTITSDSNSTVPYSPKATCSTCHEYDTINQSYHVDQGKSIISDN